METASPRTHKPKIVNESLPTHFGWKKCLSSTPIKNEKAFIKCAQNKRCTSSMYQQSLGNVCKLLELNITQTRHHKSVEDRQTQTDGQSGPTSRPAFAMVSKLTKKMIKKTDILPDRPNCLQRLSADDKSH